MPTELQPLAPGDVVVHERFGFGEVILDRGTTLVVQFRERVEVCARSDVKRRLTPLQSASEPSWHSPLEVITRCQAEAIRSVNDTWGVFSRSRIALLPHQLWVCKQILDNWPANWLVADDVGLGKTIEAGLVLWPLVSRGTVRRFLIVSPASLVDQWQGRLRHMFDLRTTRYSPDADTTHSDFWNTHDQVIGSLQTMRVENKARRQRLLAAQPWDLLIVDEAHHVNADELTGPTLGYSLAEQLLTQRKVKSVLFFTGTPHRGKDFGFFSLLKLLRPELFDPRRPATAQLSQLREVMIRNNKQNVTDMRGNRIFATPRVTPETYQYSPAEERFYNMLTEFIVTGKAYAGSLNAQDRRMVMLVLIAMQKLASSSVAAIRRALRGRLKRFTDARQTAVARILEQPGPPQLSLLRQYEGLGLEESDRASELEEQVASAVMRLMGDEESRLMELLAAADAVVEETKVNKILSILETQFAGRSVLLFTEYKATQSLIMSALNQRFGDDSVAFINGDDVAEEVINSAGESVTRRMRREEAAAQFNSGLARFLVSTEAGGEGIDLQEACHSLIHIDLPWNPMRLHQRVGRLNRYGQRRSVEVIHLRNPDTVESRIWDKLNDKLDSIMAAFNQVMDEPEDLLQLVLGMTSPSLFRELFSEADSVPHERLSEWFDEKTSTFGGKDALDTVQSLVGYASKFDFQQTSGQIPQVDLPALAPFFKTMLRQNQRLFREVDGLSFLTPEVWLDDPGVQKQYEHLVFERQDSGGAATDKIVGVGHRAFDRALNQALLQPASVASLPAALLPKPLLIFSAADSVTTEGTLLKSVTLAVEVSSDGSTALIRDWEVLERLNSLSEGRGFRRDRDSIAAALPTQVDHIAERATAAVERSLESLRLPFKLPRVSLIAILWPHQELGEPGLEDDVEGTPSQP